MKNKWGFTLVELLATITLLGILAAIGVVSVNRYLKQAREASYTDYEQTLKNAATNYAIDHSGSVPTNGQLKVTAQTLISEGYLKSMYDPKKRKETCDRDSYVLIKAKGRVNFNLDITYAPCLKCSSYQSASCG